MPWLVLAMLAAATTGDPLAPYRNVPIVAVEFEAPLGEDVEQLRRLVDIEPGYLLSGPMLEAALKRMYALGRFADVGVTAERLKGTVILHFYLRPAERVATLEIIGADLVDVAQLTRALGVGVGDDVDLQTRDLVIERGQAYLRDAGFPQATLKLDATAREGGETDYLFTLVEGPPLRISAIDFSGEPRAPAPLLRSLVPVQVGDVADRTRLEYARERLRRALLQKGFLRAKVSVPTVTADGAQARVVFPVTTGERIAFFFRGNDLLSDRALRALWPESDGSLADGDLGVYVSRITDAYRRMGYLQAHVEIRGFYEAATSIVRYVVRIDEGKPHRLHSLRFTGGKQFPEALLVRQVRSVVEQELADKGVLEQLGGSAGSPHTSKGSPVPPGERYLPELYDRALEDIVAAYRNQGFLSATVGPAQTTISGTNVDVVVPIVEGTQTFVRSVSFRNNQALTADDLLKLDDVHELVTCADEGRRAECVPFSASAVEDARITLVRRYRDDGYLYMRVFSEEKMSDDEKSADVVFRIEEGPQVRVGNVLIRGNRFTGDSIIESRITLTPGEPYRLEQALRDQRSIAALGVFSSVRVRLIDEETPGERKDVVAEVVERDRQITDISGGISTADGPRLHLGYTHLNVFGTASTFVASVNVNRKIFFSFYGDQADALRKRYADYVRDSFREQFEGLVRAELRSPLFLALPFDPSARFGLVYERDNALPYSLDSGRAIFGADFFPTERLNLTIEPQLSLTSLTCEGTAAAGDATDCSAAVFDTRRQRNVEQGVRVAFTIGPSLTLDLRDDQFNPTRGIYAQARASWAKGSSLPQEQVGNIGDLSSHWRPFSFAKVESTVTGYVPIGSLVVAVSARGGVLRRLDTGLRADGTRTASSDTPVEERFYLGGSYDIRGFAEDSLIPEDVCVLPEGVTATSTRCLQRSTTVSFSTGGNYFAVLKTELRVPLSGALSTVLFVDAGNLWVDAPSLSSIRARIGMGVGLRYKTPAGPLVFDVGVNPYPRASKGEDFTRGWPLHIEPHLALGVY